MPVGGIACGQLYLGGDGRLWYWDIFTSTTTTDYEDKIWAGPHYEHPLKPKPVVEQGFAIRGEAGGDDRKVRPSIVGGSRTSHSGASIRSRRVTYRDEALPLEI